MSESITYESGDISTLQTELEKHIEKEGDTVTFTKKIILRFKGKAGIISEIEKNTTFTKDQIEGFLEQIRDSLPNENAGFIPRPSSGFNEGANGSPGLGGPEAPVGSAGSPGPGAPVARAGSAGSPVMLMLTDAEVAGRDVTLALAYIFKLLSVEEPEGGGRRRRVTRRHKATKVRR